MINLNLKNIQIILKFFNYTYVNYNYGETDFITFIYIIITYSYIFAVHYAIYKSNTQTKKIKFKKLFFFLGFNLVIF